MSKPMGVLNRLRSRRATAPLDAREHEAVGVFAELGPTPLSGGQVGDRLSVAVVVPWLLEGSGGHNTILNLVRGLEARGHECSLWLHDPVGRNDELDLGNAVRDWFGGMQGPVQRGFEDWTGADVAVATGWQTVHRTLLLDGCAARAYLVQDHEPEFFGTSAERMWAEDTYRLGLHCVTAGEWLAGLVTQRYGATTSWFDLGVDRSVYRERAVEREAATVLFYARAFTPRRAVPLGLLALAELARRRPGVRIELFGDPRELDVPFGCEQLGILSPGQLAEAYSRATVGMALSTTNYSLIAQEMLACGLPCVELDFPSARTAFGADPPLELAAAEPGALADALERLLEDRALRERRRDAGLAFVEPRTWDAAAAQVETGLRMAVRLQARG